MTWGASDRDELHLDARTSDFLRSRPAEEHNMAHIESLDETIVP
jgi:hypothetical protein